MVINSSPRDVLSSDAINLIWLRSPGASGLTFTLGSEGQLCSHSREGSWAPPGLGHGMQHPGAGSRSRGQKREFLNPASLLAKMPANSSLRQMNSSAPGAIPLPGPTQPPSLEEGCSWLCKWLRGGAPGRANGLTQEKTTILSTSAEEMDLGGMRPR